MYLTEILIRKDRYLNLTMRIAAATAPRQQRGLFEQYIAMRVLF